MKSPLSVFVYQVERGDAVLAVVAALLVGTALYWVLRLLGFVGPRPWHERLAHLAWQMALILGLEQAYEFTRGHIAHQADVAYPNAYRVLDLELRHGLFVEQRLEHYFLHFRLAMSAIDLFYVVAHVGVTVGVLIYLYVRRQEQFWFTRNLIMMTTAFALAAFYVYPTAPPRMLGNWGFVDPAQVYHFVGAGGAQPDSYTYNPYAAMPSVHVAYALVVSWGLALAERQILVRLVVALYPIAMAATVIISGNHWILDVVGAFVTVALAGTILGAGSLLFTVLRHRFAVHTLAGRLR